MKNFKPVIGGVITNKRKRGGSYLVTAPLMKGGQA